MNEISGRCLCGAVAFTATIDRPAADACHCSQCRRWSGHFWASVNVDVETLKFTAGQEKLSWFRSSERVRRGFCGNCGSALFWQPDRHPDHGRLIAIAAGALDAPTGLALKEHIFVSDKGDYYSIADGLPQKAGH